MVDEFSGTALRVGWNRFSPPCDLFDDSVDGLFATHCIMACEDLTQMMVHELDQAYDL